LTNPGPVGRLTAVLVEAPLEAHTIKAQVGS
jgi:hypothetical protein